MKNVILAVLIALLITYSFGSVINEWFDVAIHLDHHTLGPFESLAGLSVVGIIMAIIGVVIAVSVFGAILVAVFAAVMAVVVVGSAVFWPILIVIALIVWLVRDKRPNYS